MCVGLCNADAANRTGARDANRRACARASSGARCARNLIVRDAATLRADYGDPDFLRNESQAQLCRYDTGLCAVFFFLYPEDGAWRLCRTETLPHRSGGGAGDPVCLNSLPRGAPVS